MQGFKFEFNMFLYVFFAMGPDAVDQVGFKGNVYAQIQKSKMFEIFGMFNFNGPLHVICNMPTLLFLSI